MRYRPHSAAIGAAIGIAVTAAVPSSTLAAFIVLPTVSTNTEGAAASVAPFSPGETPVASAYAYQQVYMGSAFPVGTTHVNSIAFRPDTFAGQAFSTVMGNIEIILSVTPKTSTNLSSTFADNVGTNATVIHSGSLALSSAFTLTGGPGSPRAFDIVIPLATPYAYNPSTGNLLMEVRTFTDDALCQFDFHLVDNQIGRAYAFDANATSADAVDPSRGLVTRFDVTVPAPGAAAAVLLTGAGLLVRRRRPR